MSKSEIMKPWAEEGDIESQGRRATKEKARTDSRENSSSRKKFKPNKGNDLQTKPVTRALKKPLELETDPAVLQRRQKQIDYGKNTVGYYNYTQEVPLEQRSKEHPKTPDKYSKYSRRSWDTLIKIWRRKLHEYDTEADKCQSSDEESIE